ncbi:DUF262 domain-containing HNH endonuclease family protein [uncultured Anaerococcus sp.]|uniref:DUF262 domain-containing protein n=1 Tax=uncultured Anaerococcus sp. TaxID=293428 RepID=UPI00288A77EB|nr:DUF262 domain-containing HNH endonuclease family protein [uncultured Anaerococcus sp.]
MAKKIDPELKKIGNYLDLEDSAIFSIPEYQRAYSWEIKQCDKLWQDIVDFIDSDGSDPYFFGTIIINCQDNDTKLSLIDGQQRTTTFILLCKALLLRIIKAIDETKKDEESEDLTYGLKKKRDRLIQILFKVSDSQILSVLKDLESAPVSQILENNSINELYKTELQTIINSSDFEKAEERVEKIKFKQKDNKYTNFFRNFKFFYTKLEGLTPSEANVFAEFILDKSEIIEIRSWNIEQAITMFNSLNSDGMPLLDSDIISAKLYSNSGEDREGFNIKWSEFKKIILNLEEDKITDIDNVLKQYMYINRSQSKEYISEKGSINVTTPGVRRYYTETNSELLQSPLKLTAQLLKVAKIWYQIKDYSIMKLCSKFNENLNLYLISYLFRYEVDEITENLVIEFVESLLSLFAILELVDTGYSSSKFKTFLFGLNIKLVDKNVSLSEIKDIINTHINKEWNREEIEIAARNYTKNPLVFLNEYIACKDNGQKFILPEKYEIEHIMPRSGKNIDQIREDAGIFDKEEFLEIVNKLGNKILLEEDINRSIGNAWFRSKIQNSVKERKGYKDSIFALAKQIIKEFENQANPLWTIQDIEKRTNIEAKKITDFIFE